MRTMCIILIWSIRFTDNIPETSGVGGIVSVATQRTFSTNQQYLLTYNRTFNHVHNVDILAGHENYNYKYQYLYGQRESIQSEYSRTE